MLCQKRMPDIYDSSVADISADDLKTEISKQLKHNYLAQLTQDENEVEQKRAGLFIGPGVRTFFSLPTRYGNNKPIWIHYLLDINAPQTNLSKQAIEALIGSKTQSKMLQVFINGQKTFVSRSSLRHQNTNILGMDLVIGVRQLKYDLKRKQITLTFDCC